jgi:hypothetical protein
MRANDGLRGRYLKHEVLAPPSAGAVGPGRFTSVVWHPEDPLALLLTTPGKSACSPRPHETLTPMHRRAHPAHLCARDVGVADAAAA